MEIIAKKTVTQYVVLQCQPPDNNVRSDVEDKYYHLMSLVGFDTPGFSLTPKKDAYCLTYWQGLNQKSLQCGFNDLIVVALPPAAPSVEVFTPKQYSAWMWGDACP